MQINQLVDDDVVVKGFRQQRIGFSALVHQDRQKAFGAVFAALDGHALFNVFGRSHTQHLINQTDGLTAFRCHQ